MRFKIDFSSPQFFQMLVRTGVDFESSVTTPKIQDGERDLIKQLN